MIRKDGWKCMLLFSTQDCDSFALDIILAAADVEGNFMAVKAFQYTNLLSAMLLDSYAQTIMSSTRVLTPL